MANSLPQFHTVIRGENLTTIARKYGFTNYKPIAVYNGLKNENSIREGHRIVIPRSRQGYDSVITKLNQLKVEMGNMTKSTTNQLKIDKEEFDRKNKVIDISCEVLTIAVGVGRIGAKAVVASRDVVTKMPVIKKAMIEVGALLAEKAKGKAEDLAFDAVNKSVFDEKSQGAVETTYKVYRKKYDLAFKYAKKGLKVLDVAEVALDFIQPSTIAKYYTAWVAGESVEETEENAKKMIERTHQQAIMNLNEKITRLTNERNLLYSNQQMSMPVLVH
ncbi:LysM peptidoglycan-binding domain-containing protein [Cesiribacter sp. SM1]|uniref:LysM peptidoglycan-binding domain-containing protein n=1 Tax=Cesiribacter sp. SM1 TaxID=2861196 RepID=UPI001CD80ACD|nr:LysM peptidoglycan-binding domain-containing protein [Cesiribacter sp. SM1]